MTECLLKVSGVVQGVFFRRTVARHAQLFPVSGYVKNLPSGEVEILVQGQKNEIENFVFSIQADPGAAVIKSIDKTWRALSEKRLGFQIIR
jgi:acylphosphatase